MVLTLGGEWGRSRSREGGRGTEELFLRMTQGRESNNYRVVKTIKERRKGMDKDGGRERGEKRERPRERERETETETETERERERETYRQDKF